MGTLCCSALNLQGPTPFTTFWGKPYPDAILLCVAIQFPDGKGFPVTARPMTPGEKPKEAQALKRMARSEGVQEALLVREWVREKLRGSLSNKPPNKALQPSARRTRRG